MFVLLAVDLANFIENLNLVHSLYTSIHTFAFCIYEFLFFCIDNCPCFNGNRLVVNGVSAAPKMVSTAVVA